MRSKAYETSCWTSLSMSKVKVCAEELEYNAESEVRLMHVLPTIIARFHVEPMNNIKVTANMYIT